MPIASSIFSFEIRATTTISASVSAVWQTLTEVENYHAWSSMLHYELQDQNELQGQSGGSTIALGDTLSLRLTLPQGADYSFSPKVVAFEAEHIFTWRATTLFQGIFDGEHSFVLEPLPDNQTYLVNREVYSGLLAPLFKHLPMMQGAQEGFAAMNHEIKTHSESLSSS